MKTLTLKKNLIYQALYQIMMLVIPLALSKYVTNLFCKDILGTYSYSYSIASYFVVLSMLGIQKYGTRAISCRRDDELLLRKTFWSLFCVHSLFSVIASLLYFGIVFLIPFEGKTIFYLQGLYVVSALFDITWFFYGIENFRSVVIKNTFIKVCEIALILLLVRTDADLWIYTLIMAGSVLAGQVVLLPSAIKAVRPVRVSRQDILMHIKPLLVLSIAVLATSIYAILDKTLLGALSPAGAGDTAIYEYSDKIVKIPLSFLAAVETVMLPRMSNLNAKNDSLALNGGIRDSVLLISCLAMGGVFGIIAITDPFVSLWYGADYGECKNVIPLLAPVIFTISFGDIIRSQYLIPKSKDVAFTITIIVGAVVNLILNLALIPTLGIYGAVIGTLVAETLISFIQLMLARKELPVFRYLIEPLPFLLFGGAMWGVCYWLEHMLGVRYLTLLLQILVGGAVYLALSFLYLLITNRQLIKKLFKKAEKNT